MVDPQIIAEWIKKADEDFDFAASVIKDSPYVAQICFHFHQSAEKYLKAFIIANNLELKKIHDLPVLLSSCSTIRSDLSSLHDSCKFLNRYYIDARYPVPWPTEYDGQEAYNAMDAAAKIRTTIKSALNLPS